MNTIDITGIDKAELLVSLHENATPTGLGWLHPHAFESLTKEEAESALKECTQFDYFRGRPLKVDLSSDRVDPRLYDRDAGQGAFARIVEQLRNHETI